MILLSKKNSFVNAKGSLFASAYPIAGDRLINVKQLCTTDVKL